MNELLSTVDDIGYSVAILRDNGDLYAREKRIILKNQANYVHLSCVNRDESCSQYIKQRSEKWFEIREKSKISGSTINNAIGLGTLKQQQEHFDKVEFKKATKEPSEETKCRLEYGTKNEIHAIATLVGKILPVYGAKLSYIEEGCYKVNIGENQVPLVVSPDGSVRGEPFGEVLFGVECKCPYPDKTYTTQVHYKIPKYYVTQILAEMHVLNVKHLYYICYTSESTTVFLVEFDEELWEDIKQEVDRIYTKDRPVRPDKKSAAIPVIKEKIENFLINNVTFLVEIPSVYGIECDGKSETTNVFCMHSQTDASSEKELFNVRQLQIKVRKLQVSVTQAYILTRTKATEFLGFMLSDLDREYHSERHPAVPVAYGLKGYSLPTTTIRKMIEFVLKECWDKGLYTPICCFDGQWSHMAVRDGEENPLTILQLQKTVFSSVKRLSKSEIIRNISALNVIKCNNLEELTKIANLEYKTRTETLGYNTQIVNEITVSCIQSVKRICLTRNLYKLLNNKQKKSEDSPDETGTKDLTDQILSSLPEGLLKEMEEELIQEVSCVAETVTDGNNEEREIEKPSDIPDINISEMFDENIREYPVSMEVGETIPDPTQQATENCASGETNYAFLENLNRDDMKKNFYEELQSSNKRSKLSLDQFTESLTSAEQINKTFTKAQIIIFMQPISGLLKSNGIKWQTSSLKSDLVNIVSDVMGNGSSIQKKERRKQRQPKSLKVLSREAVQKLSKNVLNCVYAQFIFPEEFKKWQNKSVFGPEIVIEGVAKIEPNEWYSMPEFNGTLSGYLFVILDAYHQICGLRRLFCGPGIPRAGIESKFIKAVAENSKDNKCGLNASLVNDLLDKQSIAYAVQTFSEPVEKALSEIGATKEATFCNLVRNWYLSEDEPGLSAMERCLAKLDFRNWLLKGVRFDVFPPYGSYVRDIPMVLFEGLLIGIERKLQLYPFVKSGTYNIRSVGSLDIENFFSSFQDIDPRGAGVLSPDDIPAAISVAMELIDARLDPKR